MGYNIQIIIEKNGRKAQFASLKDIDLIEHSTDQKQATFRFHVEGAVNETLGSGAKLVVLDKHKEIQKLINPEPVASGNIPLIPLGSANAESKTTPPENT